MKKRRLGKRIGAFVLCLLMVITIMNLPLATMEVKAGAIGNRVTINNIVYELYKPSAIEPMKAKVISSPSASGDIIIPSSVTINGTDADVTLIDGAAFQNTAITSITLPNTVKTINNNAFQGCTGLTKVEAPNVTAIFDYAFSSCTSLTTVETPELVSIYGYAFRDCSALKTIDTTKLTELDQNAFQNCSSLENIDLSSLRGGTSGADGILSSYVFSYCTSLSNVTIPASIDKIGNGAFSGCTNLSDVTIHASIDRIGQRAFAGCSANIEFISNTPPVTVYSDSFDSGVTFKVPNGAKAAYESTFSTVGINVTGKITERSSGSSGNNSTNNTVKVETHTHKLAWVTISEPTLHAKGLIELKCTTCGYVAEKQYVGNDAVVYETYANKLEEQFGTIKAGGTAHLELGDWHSVPDYMMERIIESNVNVELTFRYKGINYDIVIPAGQAVDLHIPWYGPLLLNSLYGTK